MHDTLKGPQISIKGGSDGSFYPDDKVMTAAWIIAEDETNFTSACTVIRNVSSLSSYRAELEGTFRLLRHIDWLGLTPEEVRHWCDNKGAIKANRLPAIQTPTDMLAPDADLILAIMAIKKKISANIKCRYVAGHQDEKKRKIKSSKERRKERREKRRERLERIQTVEIKGGTHAPLPEPIADDEDHHASDTSVESVRELGAEKHLSDKVLLNVACDSIAGEAAERFVSDPTQALPPTLQPPYSGSKAMLRIGDIWVTSDYNKNIHFASTAPRLRDYCMRRHKWNTTTMGLIHWDAIKSNRKNMGRADQCRTMKVLHGWLPIMHNLGKYKRLTQCPGCSCHDETFDHLFRCKHPLMVKALSDSKEQFVSRARDIGIHKEVVEKFMQCIECGIDRRTAPLPTFPQELRGAMTDQNTIGTSKLLQGYMAKSWVDAMKCAGVKHPYQKAKTLQRSLWDVIFQRVWDTRNHILHHTPNLYRNTESTDLRERPRYYRDNKNSPLSYHDQSAADHSDETIEAMGRLTRRRWVKHLDKLSAQFQKERQNREAGQLSLPRLLGLASPERTVPQRVRHTPTQARRKIQTSLNFTVKRPENGTNTSERGGTNASGRGGPNASGRGGPNTSGYRSWRPPAQRCAGASIDPQVISPSPRRIKWKNDLVSTIPPATTWPVGLRSGETTSAGPIARTGPTRHSGERILVVDTNT